MKVFLTGGTGMVGRNILEHAEAKNHEFFAPSHQSVDLLDFPLVTEAIEGFKPDLVINTAGLVGGIQANMDGLFDFLMNNITMGLNVVKAAKQCGVPKLINLGSTCMYPCKAPQPMKEEYLFSGPLEPTNEGYAIAKTVVQRACQYASQDGDFQYKTYIPCNLWGRWDHYDPEKSHLLPAIIRKLHQAKITQNFDVGVWGTGTPRREFMDAADLADFIFFSLGKFQEVPDVVNVSPGSDLSILEIYKKVASCVLGPEHSKVEYKFDTSKPDGMFRKLTDISKQTILGWRPKITFETTVGKAYEHFLQSEGLENRGIVSVSQPKTALITGVAGQDGSYLAEFLLGKGYHVIGVVRRNSQPQHSWLKDIFLHPHFTLVSGNMSDAASLWQILEKYRPDEIYNLAAMSHVKVSFECPEEAFDVIAMGTLRLLNAARILVPNARIYQAGSSEQFGSNPVSPQNEETAFMPASPYGVAKVAAHNICVNYREAYGMFISVGILHNHTSPRRGENFVCRKITLAAAKIKTGTQEKLQLGNLEACRDFGYAKEYVEFMWKMLQHDKPENFMIATGETHSVREFLEVVFEHAGLDWKEYVEFDPALLRPQEVPRLLGDASKAKRVLGWEPKIRFKELAKLMYEADLHLITDL